jgi:hypothetical protein
MLSERVSAFQARLSDQSVTLTRLKATQAPIPLSQHSHDTYISATSRRPRTEDFLMF